jgi:hypothetical protein
MRLQHCGAGIEASKIPLDSIGILHNFNINVEKQQVAIQIEQGCAPSQN